MLAPRLTEALEALARAIRADPRLVAALEGVWRDEREGLAPTDETLRAHANALDRELPAVLRTQVGLADLTRVMVAGGADVVLAWASACAGRRDVRLARLLGVLSELAPSSAHRVVAAARARVIEGPASDALACVPLLGSADAVMERHDPPLHARLEVLVWEAGASALAVAELGAWYGARVEGFEAFVGRWARGSLRRRVLAARALEVGCHGMPLREQPELVERTLRILQPLLLHPEPLVWVHAARALGRLTGRVGELEGTLLDWARGEVRVLRQRATTAVGCVPPGASALLRGQLEQVLSERADDDEVLAALAASTPYLFEERRDVWEALAARIASGAGGPVAARALARGLGSLWRRGVGRGALEASLRALRRQARRARPDSFAALRRWIEVLAETDVVEDAERDPLDVERGLDNLVRIAAQYDDEEADARAARFAQGLGATFAEARRIAESRTVPRHRAAAINAMEGCARALALGLWGPLLDTSPSGPGVGRPDLSETWAALSRAPTELLGAVQQARRDATDDPEILDALELAALRVGSYVLDALGEGGATDRSRGAAAFDACRWLRQLDPARDRGAGTEAFRRALSGLFWRLVDGTQGTALGEVDDVEWLGPFAAWWGLVVDRPAVLRALADALPLLSPDALEQCCAHAEALRAGLEGAAPNGVWASQVRDALGALRADATELAAALLGLAAALRAFATVAGHRPELEPACVQLVVAAERLRLALADPVAALRRADAAPVDDSLTRASTENAPRIATLLARAVRTRQPALVEAWLASLDGPCGALVEAALRAAVARTPPPPPSPPAPRARTVAGYEVVRPLGEGGVGTVWLVRRPGADRLFVLKIPKADLLASASETEREGLLASFVEEARTLAGLYHPNVASIVDRGVHEGMPFLVLEYLLGADLRQYAAARPCTLFELRSIVADACAGLDALHRAGLVHRDVKPANLWLRLPLAGGESFDPARHRDPARTPPLSTVLIDFGMVRAMRVPAEVGGRFVAGTPGYIAPEQVLDPVELDGRADVYSLAATVYHAVTGRAFFDDIEDRRARIAAHMKRSPFEDESRLRPFPAAMRELLCAATAMRPADRPTPLEFAARFAAAI
ncbi:MAG: serine/threonine-protein kinase [Myxococcales bacterium]|nr:serine/threonine-protein kinase [Myxococcales bacterium]